MTDNPVSPSRDIPTVAETLSARLRIAAKALIRERVVYAEDVETLANAIDSQEQFDQVIADRMLWRRSAEQGAAKVLQLEAEIARLRAMVPEESAVIALVAGPYNYHHKMDDFDTRVAESFDRCRELTIENIRIFYAIRAAAPQEPKP